MQPLSQIQLLVSLIATLSTFQANASDTKLLNKFLETFKSMQNSSNYVSITESNNVSIDKDTDGDGLLDTTSISINGKIIAPKDSNPLSTNAPIGVWQKQIQIEKAGNIPNKLEGFYKYEADSSSLQTEEEINWEEIDLSNQEDLNKLLNSQKITEISSNILTFRVDNGGTVLHSQTQKDMYEYILSEAKKELTTTEYIAFYLVAETLNIEDSLETWQKKYGYNDLYDKVFSKVTNGNMRNEKFFFKDKNNTEYVLWVWRGDYLAIGAGAEMGLYTKNTSKENTEHWDAVDFAIPMTLNLYNYNSPDDIEPIFNWKPMNNQWWITGFNPNCKEIDVTKQVMIGSLDFSEHKDMYESLKIEVSKDSNLNKYAIFDDSNSTVWINWY